MALVAQFIDSLDPGGAETIVVEIAREIRDAGHSSLVLHFGNAWLEAACQKHGLDAMVVPGHHSYTSAATLPLFIPKLLRILKRQKIDIIHSHLYGSVICAAVTAPLAGIPHVGTLHDVYTLEEKKSRVRLLGITCRMGTKLVAVSKQLSSYLRMTGDFEGDCLVEIENGVDVGKYDLAVSRRDYPELLLKQTDHVFICVGRLEKIKGHDILIKSFAKIHPSRQARLLIVGDGPCKQELKDQISGLGLEGIVQLLGQRDDVPGLLNISDCFILSSHSEGLSRSIIEAMAASLPIIATDVGGNGELVSDGVNGHLVKTGDSDSLAEKLALFMSDPARMHAMGKKSREFVLERYSLDQMMRKYMDLYKIAPDRAE